MPPTLTLPRADGTLTRYTLTGQPSVQGAPGPIASRIGMAAVHVVANPLAPINPTLDVAVDWDATLAFRRHIWSLGLAVAEAMDTSQRGMGFHGRRRRSSSSAPSPKRRRCRARSSRPAPARMTCCPGRA
jgi:hypothetical protein